MTARRRRHCGHFRFGAAAQQKARRLSMAVPDGDAEGRFAAPIACLNIGAVFQQELASEGVIICRRAVKRRRTKIILGVYVGDGNIQSGELFSMQWRPVQNHCGSIPHKNKN